MTLSDRGEEILIAVTTAAAAIAILAVIAGLTIGRP